MHWNRHQGSACLVPKYWRLEPSQQRLGPYLGQLPPGVLAGVKAVTRTGFSTLIVFRSPTGLEVLQCTHSDEFWPSLDSR